jgi:dTDP-4-dehydrorhamnose reductase
LLYGLPAAPRRSTFLEQVAALRERRKLVLFHDEVRSPLSLEDAASALIRLAQSDASGIFHLGGPERLTRVEMALLTARALGIEDPIYEAVSRLSVPGAGPRPRDLSLSSERYTIVFGQAPGRRMAEALPELLAGAL